MRYLSNDPASRSGIRSGDRLVQLRDPEALDDLFLIFGVTDHAPVVLDLDLTCCFCFLCHDLIKTELRPTSCSGHCSQVS